MCILNSSSVIFYEKAKIKIHLSIDREIVVVHTYFNRGNFWQMSSQVFFWGAVFCSFGILYRFPKACNHQKMFPFLRILILLFFKKMYFLFLYFQVLNNLQSTSDLRLTRFQTKKKLFCQGAQSVIILLPILLIITYTITKKLMNK